MFEAEWSSEARVFARSFGKDHRPIRIAGDAVMFYEHESEWQGRCRANVTREWHSGTGSGALFSASE